MEDLVDTIMHRYDPVNLLLIKKQIRENIKTKNGKNLIESGFLLRILLEFFRSECRNRYKLLKEAFMSQSNIGPSGKFCISFVSFKRII